MPDRIHEYLEGRRDRASLTPEEQARADEMEAVIGGVSSDLRSRTSEDLTARVMARVNALPLPRRRGSPTARAVGWLTRSRRISLAWRPVYGLAAAVFALVVAYGLFALGEADIPSGDLAEAVAPTVFVQFQLRDATATQVSLVGSFNDWEPRHQLSRSESGVWTITVPVEPGVHEYAFLIDGERWVVDPDAPQVADDFGGLNNRIPVLIPTSS